MGKSLITRALVLLFLMSYIVVVDGEEEPITTDSAIHNDPAISGNLIVWTEEENNDDAYSDIYMFDFSKNIEKQITTNSENQYSPDTDGNRIVWVDNRNDDIDIYMYDLSTNTEKRITTNSAEQHSPAISGNFIVWQDIRNGNWDIYMYDLSTNTEKQITKNSAHQSYPKISGNRIVWEDDRNGNSDIYIYDLSTNTKKQITTNSADQRDPAISGNRIVWRDYRNGNYDIYMYDLSTSTEKQITKNSADQYNPAISGNLIVWYDYRNGISDDIYMYDLSTNTKKQITTNSADQRDPAISGNRIVWDDRRNGNSAIYMYDLSTPSGTSFLNALTIYKEGKVSGVLGQGESIYYKIWLNKDRKFILDSLSNTNIKVKFYDPSMSKLLYASGSEYDTPVDGYYYIVLSNSQSGTLELFSFDIKSNIPPPPTAVYPAIKNLATYYLEPAASIGKENADKVTKGNIGTINLEGSAHEYKITVDLSTPTLRLYNEAGTSLGEYDVPLEFDATQSYLLLSFDENVDMTIDGVTYFDGKGNPLESEGTFYDVTNNLFRDFVDWGLGSVIVIPTFSNTIAYLMQTHDEILVPDFLSDDLNHDVKSVIIEPKRTGIKKAIIYISNIGVNPLPEKPGTVHFYLNIKTVGFPGAPTSAENPGVGPISVIGTKYFIN